MDCNPIASLATCLAYLAIPVAIVVSPFGSDGKMVRWHLTFLELRFCHPARCPSRSAQTLIERNVSLLELRCDRTQFRLAVKQLEGLLAFLYSERMSPVVDCADSAPQ